MNVLVLTDLSDVAKNAGKYAVQFLSNIPVKFYLLNIRQFHPDRPKEDAPAYMRELALGQLNNRVGELKAIAINDHHSYEIIYSENDLIGATRKVVDEMKIDLIVMGAAHKGHSPNTIIGNHTYEVIKKIKCNILAVAEHSVFKTPEKLIFPVDPAQAPNTKNFAFLNNSGIASKAKLTLVQLGGSSAEISKAYQSEISEQGINREIELKQLTRTEAFSEEQLLEVQKKFDLIILLARNITLCDELLHTKQGLYSTVANNLPILVLHN